MQLRRTFLVAVIAAALVAPAAPASATHVYAPEGGTWKTDGTRTSADYCETTAATTVPRQRGVAAWQRALNAHGARLAVTGRYDPATTAAVRLFERANFLRVDGCIGFDDARHLLAQSIRNAARKAGVPAEQVARLAWNETTLDAGAVGPDGHDLGIVQWTRKPAADAGLTSAERWDVDKSLTAAARRLARYHRVIGDWRITIVSHWSPAAALAWKRTGKPSAEALAYSERADRFPGLPDSVQTITGTPAGAKPQRPSVTPTTTPTAGKPYRVQDGMTMWSAARLAYSKGGRDQAAGRRWTEIAAANGRPGNPRLVAGEVIVIPPA